MGHEEGPWQRKKVRYDDIRSMSHFVLLFSLNILFRFHGNVRLGVVAAHAPQTVSWILIWTHRVSPWSGSCTHNYIQYILAAVYKIERKLWVEFPLPALDQGWHSLHLRCWNSTWLLSGWNADISVPKSPARKLAKACGSACWVSLRFAKCLAPRPWVEKPPQVDVAWFQPVDCICIVKASHIAPQLGGLVL